MLEPASTQKLSSFQIERQMAIFFDLHLCGDGDHHDM